MNFNRGIQNPQAQAQHQRFFATRGPELLPIRREVIRGEEPSVSVKPTQLGTFIESPPIPHASMTWPMLSTTSVNPMLPTTAFNPLMMATAATSHLLQLSPMLACTAEHSLMMSPVLVSAAEQSLMMMPGTNGMPMFPNMMGPPLSLGMAPNVSSIALPDQIYNPTVSPVISSRSESETTQRKLCYLRVDEFRVLQTLVREHGEDWNALGRIMGVRAGDLAKNWPGYSVDTNITSSWTKPEIEILTMCRSLGISCRTTAKIIATKLPLQVRRKTIKKRHIPTSNDDEKLEPVDSDGEGEDEGGYDSDRNSPSQPEEIDEAPEGDDDDIVWNTGHRSVDYKPQLLMPTTNSAIVSDHVERLVCTLGRVDWAVVSQLTRLPLQYCLEMNTYNVGKTPWSYDAAKFTWSQADALKAFIDQFYPAPASINFLAVSNFFWICLPNCIEMYELLCGHFEWTPAALGQAARLAAQGWSSARIARQLSPTMGARRVADELERLNLRKPEIQIPAGIDSRCVRAIRTVVAEILTDLNAAASADVPLILERARASCPDLDATKADLCTLAVLSTHPPFASRRTLSGAHRASRASCAAENASPVGRTGCRWTKQEIELLVQYANSTKAAKNWKYFANLLGTKTPVQCTNKYRAMRKLHQIPY
ncbi:hypothetical protein GGH12_003961 [Coemansia sp. RSA 1822]|nr:hypothetical protein LPJ76_003509 [Coemansia sp. RSA 638]KAJ2121069.1 hypothetical protein IW147_004583 [Coemansia sp. RSA 720]KAJ2542453.1 hypothetical protein GGF49_002861 [Coemansia sp. RSA 1853]KAJ2561492.1 hypothetical protein GGH12_003961 [Coemansia sp. RSA 1822]